MVNKTIIQGRLTKEPELRKTQSGVANLLFTVAWSEKYKEIETKCFLLCKAWRGTAEFIANYFNKGSEIVLEGRMVTETWSDDKQVTLLTVDKAHFAGPLIHKSEQEKEPAKAPADDFVSVPDSELEELPFE